MYIILGQQRITRAGASYFDIDAYLCIIIRNRVYGVASFVGILLSLVACSIMMIIWDYKLRGDALFRQLSQHYDDHLGLQTTGRRAFPASAR